ncbi:MAG: HU family DNA-binding protein [Spirochaetota bacterium]
MTRSTLVKAVAERTGANVRDIDRIITAVYEAIRGALERGESVELRGLGTFRMRLIRGREGHDFSTGARRRIPDRQRVQFIPGRRLKALTRTAEGNVR